MLDETPLARKPGHLADHAALKVAYDARHRGSELTAYTMESSALEHRRLHALLESDSAAQGATSTLTATPSPSTAGHLAQHEALHKGYNASESAVSAAAATTTNNGLVGFSPGGGFPYLSDAQLGSDLDLMVACGASWVRLDLPRSVINTGPGSYNWSNSDRVVNACRARGLKVLGLVFGTPAWDRPAGTSDKFGPDTSTRLANWATFCTALAKRYGTDSVAAWEIWNEPNIPVFWQPSPNPTRYIATLIAASKAFRAVRSTQPIVTAGTSPALNRPTDAGYPTYSPTEWLKLLYAGGAKAYFDVVAHHPYCYPYLPTDGDASWNAFQQVPVLRATMVANGDSAKKIALTEYGAPTGTAADATTEAKQWTIINDGFTNAIKDWSYLGAIFNYALRDSGTNVSDREQNFGIVRNNSAAKQSRGQFGNLAKLPRAT